MFKQLTNMKFPKATGRYPQCQNRHLVWDQEREPHIPIPIPTEHIRVCFVPHTKTEDKNLWLLQYTFSSPWSTASCGPLFPWCQAQQCCDEHTETVWESLGFCQMAESWQRLCNVCLQPDKFYLGTHHLPKEVFSWRRKHSTYPFQTLGHLNAHNQAGIWFLKTPVKGSF